MDVNKIIDGSTNNFYNSTNNFHLNELNKMNASSRPQSNTNLNAFNMEIKENSKTMTNFNINNLQNNDNSLNLKPGQLSTGIKNEIMPNNSKNQVDNKLFYYSTFKKSTY